MKPYYQTPDNTEY